MTCKCYTVYVGIHGESISAAHTWEPGPQGQGQLLQESGNTTTLEKKSTEGKAARVCYGISNPVDIKVSSLCYPLTCYLKRETTLIGK